ncbi:MAG: peptidoglycan bridge formation glycyltransferase FemA/FemB family protein [Mycoplasmatota bacterium]
MFTFKKNISSLEYDEFYKNADFVNFMQDYRWANVKDNFENILVGVYENDKLLLIASLLIRNVFSKYNLMYIPRGPIGDLTNTEITKIFFENIKKIAKEKNCYVINVDPFVLNDQFNYKTKEKINNQFNKDSKIIHNNLLNNKLVHKGNVISIKDSIQPRFHMVCDTSLDSDSILKSYKAKVRHDLGDFQKKRGVSYEITSDEKRLDDFISIINETEARQGINLRNKEYFHKILSYFGSDSKLFFAHLDLNVYKNYLLNNNGKEEEINKVNELLKDKDSILLSACLVILPNNKEIKIAEYLYAGNKLEFPSIRISMGIVFEAIKYCSDNNIDYINLGGVDGDFKDHLSSFKAKYDPIVFEYLGDYDLILKPLIYYPIKHLLPIYKKLKKTK